MTPRLNPFTASPAAMQPWIDLGKTIQDDGLEPLLKELVMMRTSQIHGCAFCIHYHTSDARRHGETAERLYLLSAWRESTLYSERERAALGWTEALTRMSEGHDALESARETLKAEFTEAEQIKLTLMINVINGWNRISVGFGMFIDPAVAKSTAQAAAA